ncbi:hypothetical protein AC1031_005242 [Aphanomyces cochlioides]|nr:hypothetical protein AC1031_005242 [Aphanomyces cochlioides]
MPLPRLLRSQHPKQQRDTLVFETQRGEPAFFFPRPASSLRDGNINNKVVVVVPATASPFAPQRNASDPFWSEANNTKPFIYTNTSQPVETTESTGQNNTTTLPPGLTDAIHSIFSRHNSSLEESGVLEIDLDSILPPSTTTMTPRPIPQDSNSYPPPTPSTTNQEDF